MIITEEQEQEFNYRNKIWDYLTDFCIELKQQLGDDDKRWGDTWKKRPKEGQEDRVRQTFNTYFDQYENAGVPINWQKIAGNALICWIRDMEALEQLKSEESKIATTNEISKENADEKIMWEMINQIGWGTKSTDYKTIGSRLTANYSLTMISKLNIFVRNKAELLNKRFDEYIKSEGKDTRTFWGLGDDGYWDLRVHIVGLGKEEYKKAFANPEVAKKRADNNAFTENFCYIFQHVNEK